MLLIALAVAAVVAALSWLYLAPGGRAGREAPLEQAPKALRPFTAAEVAAHASADDCWLIIGGKVFDVTPFVDQHPGGSAIFARAGQDVTKGFYGPQHPPGAFDLVGDYQIGVLQQ